MGSLNKRAGALVEYVESQVEERMLLEVETLIDVLEANLTSEEFVKVARIILEARDE